MAWSIDDLDTPAVIVDLDRVGANLRRAQAYADAHGLKLRPHIKTHKIPAFAQKQVELGAVGITCQKLGEAEVMADHGLDDILLTFNLLGRAKLQRLVALARRVRLARHPRQRRGGGRARRGDARRRARPAGAGRVRHAAAGAAACRRPRRRWASPGIVDGIWAVCASTG